MPKILIVGHSGSLNKGCEALLRSTTDIIQRHLHPETIDVISENPPADKNNLAEDLSEIRIHPADQYEPSKFSPGWWQHKFNTKILQRLCPGQPMYHTRQYKPLYQQADIIISTGGDTFSDDYGLPLEVFGELALAREVGAFTMIWAASIGPFHNKKMARHWAKQLKKINLIGIRENKSLEYLNSLGLSENLRRVADPAFLLPAHEVAVEKPTAKKVIGLGMSALVSRYGATQQHYIDSFTAFARQLLDSEETTEVWLIAHVITPSHNDAEVCQAIVDQLDATQKNRVKIIQPGYNACEIKYAIAQCDYFIGARTHSTIASLSSLVPTLSIGYSVKAVGINEDVFGHTDYVLPIQDVSLQSLNSKFQQMVERRQEIIDCLKARLPAVREMSERSGVELAKAYQAWKKNH